MSTRGVMVIKLIIPDGYMVGIWYGNIGIKGMVSVLVMVKWGE